MKAFVLLSVFLFCFAFLPNVSAQDGEADEIIKIDTALVSVPVIVSDRQGRYVPELKAEDFTLFQDGRKQEIAFFATEEEPINVALVLDTSPSTARVLDQIKRAAVEFTRLLRAEDRAIIVSFDTSIRFLSPLTSDRLELERAIRDAEIGPYIGTVMRDAVKRVVEHGFKNAGGRKAIVLLTDGMDVGSFFGRAELLDKLEESDVMIYSVFYRIKMKNRRRSRRNRGWGRRRRGGRFPERIKKRQKRAAEYLAQMSEKTAGRFYDKDVTDLKATFEVIADELRKQYRLGFYPPEESRTDGQVHRIKVKVARRNVAVRARSTYRVKQGLD